MESTTSTHCPYLDTIDRHVLDFDFEKQCSVTLSTLNVYCCLVCGKYFQGRGKKSPAFTHSLQVNHCVFINLDSTKVYCLPDDYEVKDSSLSDIQFALNPTYTPEIIGKLDKEDVVVRCLDGNDYHPGIVGLNDIKNNTSINAVLQALMRVSMLRNFFLKPENYVKRKSKLLNAFGQLTRRLWSRGLFKAHISPHEVLQAISSDSKKHFRSGEASEPVEFLSWLLNTFHRKLQVTETNSSIIHTCFQGEVEITTFEKKKKKKKRVEPKKSDTKKEDKMEDEEDSLDGYEAPTKSKSPFLYLSVEVPPPPLFVSESEKDIIPQVSIYTLLSKFDGKTLHHITRTEQKKRYTITSPPPYLILHFKRFSRNQYFLEKNRTIVNFPLKDLDLSEYCSLPKGKENTPTTYHLLASIRHEDEREEELNKTLSKVEGDKIEGHYLVDIQNKATSTWYTIMDLIVTERTVLNELTVSEAYIQIYERADVS